VIVLSLVLVAIAAPFLGLPSPVKLNIPQRFLPPGPGHWFGTDQLGRDVLSRVVHGARVSLMASLFTMIAAALPGVLLGIVAGVSSARIAGVIMRLMDAFLTFPPLLLAVAIVGSLGPDIQNVMLALGIVNIPVFARLVRGSTLAVREELYVAAARSLGAGATRIVLVHVLRNVMAPIVVQMTVTFSAAIIAEASLSFLGLGAQPPHPSWGRDLNEARRFLVDGPWLVLAPTLAIMTAVLSLNFIGDGLRDATDPRSWRAR